MEAYSLSGAGGGAIGVEPLTKNYGSKVGFQPPVPVPLLNKFLHYTPLGCYVTELPTKETSEMTVRNIFTLRYYYGSLCLANKFLYFQKCINRLIHNISLKTTALFCFIQRRIQGRPLH